MYKLGDDEVNNVSLQLRLNALKMTAVESTFRAFLSYKSTVNDAISSATTTFQTANFVPEGGPIYCTVLYSTVL